MCKPKSGSAYVSARHQKPHTARHNKDFECRTSLRRDEALLPAKYELRIMLKLAQDIHARTERTPPRSQCIWDDASAVKKQAVAIPKVQAPIC